MIDDVALAVLELISSFTSRRIFMIVVGLLATIATLTAIVWALVRPN